MPAQAVMLVIRHQDEQTAAHLGESLLAMHACSVPACALLHRPAHRSPQKCEMWDAIGSDAVQPPRSPPFGMPCPGLRQRPSCTARSADGMTARRVHLWAAGAMGAAVAASACWAGAYARRTAIASKQALHKRCTKPARAPTPPAPAPASAAAPTAASASAAAPSAATAAAATPAGAARTGAGLATASAATGVTAGAGAGVSASGASTSAAQSAAPSAGGGVAGAGQGRGGAPPPPGAGGSGDEAAPFLPEDLLAAFEGADAGGRADLGVRMATLLETAADPDRLTRVAPLVAQVCALLECAYLAVDVAVAITTAVLHSPVLVGTGPPAHCCGSLLQAVDVRSMLWKFAPCCGSRSTGSRSQRPVPQVVRANFSGVLDGTLHVFQVEAPNSCARSVATFNVSSHRSATCLLPTHYAEAVLTHRFSSPSASAHPSRRGPPLAVLVRPGPGASDRPAAQQELRSLCAHGAATVSRANRAVHCCRRPALTCTGHVHSPLEQCEEGWRTPLPQMVSPEA